MNYVVEKGVPIPPKGKILIDMALPCHELEIGDSFLVPATDFTNITAVKRRVSEAQGLLGARQFEVRVLPGRGVRVWRTR